MTPEDLQEKSRSAVDAWNTKDLDRFFAHFRDDVVYHGGADTELQGVAQLRERYSAALRFCPDLTITTEFLVAGHDGRSSASIQTEAGTTVEGKPFGFRGMVFLRFDDGGLVEEIWEMTSPLA